MILFIHNSHYYWVGGPPKVSLICTQNCNDCVVKDPLRRGFGFESDF